MDSQRPDAEATGPSYIHTVDVAASQIANLRSIGNVSKGEVAVTEVDPDHCTIHSTYSSSANPTVTKK